MPDLTDLMGDCEKPQKQQCVLLDCEKPQKQQSVLLELFWCDKLSTYTELLHAVVFTGHNLSVSQMSWQTRLILETKNRNEKRSCLSPVSVLSWLSRSCLGPVLLAKPDLHTSRPINLSNYALSEQTEMNNSAVY